MIPLSERATLLGLYSYTNVSIWKKDVGWRDIHSKDDPILQPSTEYLVDFTPLYPSMPSNYPRINWLTLPAYLLLQKFWHNCNSYPTPFTGDLPPIFWILIVSKSFIFCTIISLVIKSPPALARWLTLWSWSYPSPPYLGTSLTRLVCPRTFAISAWMILTSMVISPPS